MEPAQAKPPKKRRRWPIAAVLLFVVSTVSWWYWPRGDARFVGKWGAASRSGERYPSELHFRSGGTGFLRLLGRDSSTFNWQASGDKLVIDTPWINEKVHGFLEDFYEWRIGVYGGRVGFGNVAHRILDVSADSIRLEHLPTGKECMLIRIPE